MRILAKSRRLATGLAALAIGIAPPAAAQTVTPSSGVWSTTSSGATVTASTVAKDNTAPFTLTIAQPTGSGAYPVTVYASLMGVYPNWATNTYSYGGPVYQLTGTGTQGSVSNAQEGYIVGPNFNATIGSASTVYSIWNTGASATPATANSLGGTPALLAVSSTGAPGAVSYGTKHPGGGSYNAGAGGSITISQLSTLLLSVTGFSNPNGITLSPLAPIGSAVMASSQGGVGSDPYDGNGPGAGGGGGAISITNSGTIAIANTISSGTVNAITAVSVGNLAGVDCCFKVAGTKYQSAYWGTAGSGGAVSITHSGAISDTTSLTNGFSNTGNLIGIVAASLGGGIFVPSQVDAIVSSNNNYPPNVGSGGAVSVTVASGGSISLTSGSAVGILAGSFAGAYPYPFIFGSAATGGTVTVVNNGSIATGNANSLFAAGIIAVSSGSSNIIDPFGTHTVSTGSFGFGSAVSVTNTGRITSNGSFGIGVAGLSLGTAGIATNAGGGANVLGSSNPNCNGCTGAFVANSVTLNNTGTITTLGASAFGMVAINTPAGGLLRSDINSVFSASNTAKSLIAVASGHSVGNNSSPEAANGGTVSVTNSGTVTTGSSAGGGNMSIGILAQSIGGGGGSSGGLGAAAFVGDAGGSGGAGGAVSVTNSGTLTTYNDGATGILAQSIGGGGGNGGNAAGVFVAVGGQGGLGGSGGTITLNLGSSGSIATAGDFAAGVMAHSIGGGGGNGGYAKSAGLFVSNAIGGAGGSGGAGGTVIFTNGGQSIITAGNGAHGVLLQSIGGGGGNGGGALAYSAGVIFAESLAVGGNGGSGGAGGAVYATNGGAITTASPDAMGLVAQSIGGGGGNAGGALTKSFAAAGDPEIPTLQFSTAVGGTGGSGGAGGAVTITNTGLLTTTGTSATGLLAQSIGGGGGNGGDSTAAATIASGKAGGLQLTTGIGGSGGTASSGGMVSVTNGAAGNTAAWIATSGNNGTGILAQSIGGGGGNGGGGNASSVAPNLAAAGVTAGFTLGISTAVGGHGGGGGDGSLVEVTNYGGVITAGSAGQGILAQSIGGGGTVNINLSIGGSGGNGGAGGSVFVINSGKISTGQTLVASTTGLGYPVTTGGDAVGILAQSIGGGGGVGGSSDPAGGVTTAAMLENLLAGSTPLAYAANVNLGGSGGSGGSGGQVSVTNSGTIQTLGLRAHGILAQSIGGGGGSGGSVVTQPGTLVNSFDSAVSQWVAPTISANIGLGGRGGTGGSGGSVSFANSGTIVTAGYGAIGVLAQSIGGGGGIGADGSTGMGISIQLGGNGGSGNNGGAVSLGSPSAPLTGTIASIGDDAHAVIAQSIGGGGGLASGTCTNSAAAGYSGLSATRCIGNTSVSASVVPWAAAGALSLNMPGSTGSPGDGGAVNVSANGAIVTAGARAIGIVVQSIGGGGGFVTAAAANIANVTMLSNPGQNYASGGPVTVSLGSSGSITTRGAGAWGILAQSIGGSGGFMGDPSLPLAIPASQTLAFISSSSDRYANGGTVTINLAGNITTTGPNAHGVVAQSIGAGGGIAAGWQYQSSAQVMMGNAAQFNSYTGSPSYSGTGGTITVNQTGGTISTSGAGSIGILVQSSGNNAAQHAAFVNVGGTVIGGTGPGSAGILLSGGAGPILNTTTNTIPNVITINSGGSVSTVDGVNGNAIMANSGLTNVVINAGGTVTGNVNLGSTPGDMLTNAGGTFNAGPTVVVAQSTFTNAGNLFIAGQGPIGSTTINGGFKQTATGILGIDVNSLAAQRSDTLTVLGRAQIGGTIVPTATTLLPGSLPILSATSLTATATVQQGIVMGWNATVAGNTLSVAPSANFRPAGLSLGRSQGSAADYLTRSWNNADQRFANTFAYLSQMQTGAQYTNALAVITGQAHTAQPQAMLNNAPLLLGAAMGCPVYASAGTVLTETGCVWARLSGGWGRQSAEGGDGGYGLSSVTYRLGGQYQVALGWFLGASFGFGQNWTQSTGFSSTGQLYDGSITLRREIGRFGFSAAFGVGSGEFRNNRSFVLPATGTLPGVGAALQSTSNMVLLGGRLRADYEIAFTDTYLRPYVDLDLIHSQVPGFQETGGSGLPLSFSGSNKTNFVLSPMLELGARRDLNDQTMLRPFIDLGISIRPDINRTMTAQVIGGAPADGGFNVYGHAPTVIGRMNLGLQVFHTRGIDLRLEYGLMAGGSYTGQTATARLAYHF